MMPPIYVYWPYLAARNCQSVLNYRERVILPGHQAIPEVVGQEKVRISQARTRRLIRRQSCREDAFDLYLR